MKLSAAASHFDNQSFKDSYSGVHALYGQLDLYDDARREGLTSVRRIISMAPALAVPARRALTLGSDVWLLSDSPASDYFRADAIRAKYISHRADGLGEIKTILQELSNTAGVSAYGAAVWLKGNKEIDESSEVTNSVNIYFASSEAVPDRGLIKLRNVWYIVRYTYSTTTGFVAAVADQLDTPNFETASYARRVYAPITDTYTSTPVSIKVLRLRWQDKFEYLSPASAKYDAGDDVVMVRVADVAAPTTGDLITLTDGVRRVESIQADGSLWHLHVRLV
jgi:hypothetical protein